ncbi:c2H2-type domain-containing protein [Trichonephila clavipes]|nr:c2H2-type domain-containing protein [Trichonephila clavipes]
MYTCNICGKNFVTNYVLKRHTLQVHEKNAVLQCADCSKKFVRESDLKRNRDSVHSTEKITCKFCYTSFTRKDNLLKHLNNIRCERKLEKRSGKRTRVDLSVSSRKKKTQLFTSAENSTADPENIFLSPKENESAFQKAYKTFNLPNNDSSLGIKEFLLLRKEETIFIFRNELETYKALKVSKWVHCIYSKATDAGKMIKNVEFKTPNNDVLQGTNLARLYDDMSEKIVKESEDFEGRDSGWTLDEILRLEVRTNRYSPFRGSSSFIEVPKQIAETKAIINVINKKDSQCFMWSILAALYPNTSNPNKTSSYVPHLNKLNFDGISFPTPLNEVKNFSKMNDIGINIYSFEEDLKIFPLLISDIVYESDVGYILEVDLEYPSDLHDKHSDFPLAPENKPPPNCKEPRLLTTLEPKTKYVLHYSNLKLYLKLGDMKEDINLYDTSDYDENNIYNLPLVNKKVIGKMKDENKGNRENNSTQQQERTTQLGSRNETTQLVSRNETTQLNRRKQLNSSVGTKQLNSTGENNSTRQ